MKDITQDEVIDYLVSYYQAIHCMKHHDDRLASRLIQQALRVLRNEELEELPNCDCYECAK